jgi:hypothetical protein
VAEEEAVVVTEYVCFHSAVVVVEEAVEDLHC